MGNTWGGSPGNGSSVWTSLQLQLPGEKRCRLRLGKHLSEAAEVFLSAAREESHSPTPRAGDRGPANQTYIPCNIAASVSRLNKSLPGPGGFWATTDLHRKPASLMGSGSPSLTEAPHLRDGLHHGEPHEDGADSVVLPVVRQPTDAVVTVTQDLNPQLVVFLKGQGTGCDMSSASEE